MCTARLIRYSLLSRYTLHYKLAVIILKRPLNYCCSLARAQTSGEFGVQGCLGIIQFCDNNNVSDQLVLQCVISCVDFFQTIQFYAFTALTLNTYCFALSIFKVSGVQIHDIEVPAVQFLNREDGHESFLEY